MGAGEEAGGGGDTRLVLQSVTRHEQTSALFYLMGEVFYNKRD